MRRLLTLLECAGKTVESTAEEDYTAAILFTDGTAVVLAAECDTDDDYAYLQLAVPVELCAAQAFTLHLCDEEEARTEEAEAKRKDAEQTEARERAQLARLREKYPS
jgi:hypothetical protein